MTTAVKLSLIRFGTGKTQLRYTNRQLNHNANKSVLQYITRFIFTFRTKFSPQFDVSTDAKTGDPVEISEIHFCYMIVRKRCRVISISPTSRLLGLTFKLTRINFCLILYIRSISPQAAKHALDNVASHICTRYIGMSANRWQLWLVNVEPRVCKLSDG